jgi:hypothetical protein
MSRIEIQDTGMDIITKLAEDNPGAMSACVALLEEDPHGLVLLDKFEIYGSSIYVIWSDQCDRDAGKMMSLLGAAEILGEFDLDRLNRIAADQMRRDLKFDSL